MRGGSTLLRAAALAEVPDFGCGALAESPARRLIAGPAGERVIEPLAMLVLVALAEAGGRVVAREALVRRCWGMGFVAEKSVNRAVSQLRQALARVGEAQLVETIPRTGYRLTRGVSWSSEAEVAFAAAIARGRHALSAALPDQAQAVEPLQAATRLRPGNALAWGLLATAYRNLAEYAGPNAVSAAVEAAREAAARALAIDPAQGDALAAVATLSPEYGDWAGAEDRLRDVLGVAPDTLLALSHLEMLMQSVGRTAESLAVNEVALAHDPLSPLFGFRRALKAWIFGDVAAADRRIDATLQLWPRHPAVWNARMMLFAFTGRAASARAMLDDEPALPDGLAPPARMLWSVTLDALDSRSAGAVDAARRALADAAARSYASAVIGIMALSVMEEVDAAFELAEIALLRVGPRVGSLFAQPRQLMVHDLAWRRTMPLFVPATAAMRADGRFRLLAERTGLASYWRRRGVPPDPHQGDFSWIRWSGPRQSNVFQPCPSAGGGASVRVSARWGLDRRPAAGAAAPWQRTGRSARVARGACRGGRPADAARAEPRPKRPPRRHRWPRTPAHGVRMCGQRWEGRRWAARFLSRSEACASRMVPLVRLELTTPSLRMMCSTG